MSTCPDCPHRYAQWSIEGDTRPHAREVCCSDIGLEQEQRAAIERRFQEEQRALRGGNRAERRRQAAMTRGGKR
jgi:Spy/CpxP family protein refolding chaperone